MNLSEDQEYQDDDSDAQPIDEREAESSVVLNQLLQRVQQGDTEAEDILYQRYAMRLVSLAASRISNAFNSKIGPDDILQSVFKSFFVRHREDKLSFKNWNELWSFLACVTIRKCREKIRWYKTEKRDVANEAPNDEAIGQDKKFDVVSPEPTPMQVLVFEESLKELLSVLTETQQEIVLMRLQGFTNREISEKSGRTERTIYRALETLRDKMIEMGYTE